MRRKDREINDITEIMSIIKKCDVCSVAFFDKEYPYVVPLNFGAALVEGQVELYFHGAHEGKKIELLKRNNSVAFEMNCSHNLLLGDKACDATMEFDSVCGTGKMEILKDEDKIIALTALMNQYTTDREHEFDRNSVKAVTVLKLSVKEITGKRLKVK